MQQQEHERTFSFWFWLYWNCELWYSSLSQLSTFVINMKEQTPWA